MARQLEVIKKQQTDLRGENEKDLDTVTVKRRLQKQATHKSSHQTKNTSASQKHPQTAKHVNRCGKSPGHRKSVSSKGGDIPHLWKKDTTAKCVDQLSHTSIFS